MRRTHMSRVLICGDSLTVQGLADYLRAYGNIWMLGTQVADAGTDCEGHSGKTWDYFDVTVMPDVSAYLATIAATPEIIVWALGTNDIFRAITLAQMLASADSLMSRWTAVVPTVKHYAVEIPPGNGPPYSAGAGTSALCPAWWPVDQPASVAGYRAHFDRVISGHIGAEHYISSNAVHPLAAGYAQLGLRIARGIIPA